MALMDAKWIRKDSNSLETNPSQELQVKVSGAIERTSSGINIAAASVTNTMLAGNISDDKLLEKYIQADGSQSFTADQSMGGHRLTAVSEPFLETDAANKGYVDAVAQGLNVKKSCRLATTIELVGTYSLVSKTLTANNNGTLIVDLVAPAIGERILVKDQTSDLTQNGIYVVSDAGSSSTPWILTRSTDFNGDVVGEIEAGDFTFITEGSVNHDSGWVLITDDPITIDSSNLEFQQFSGAGQIIAGDGLIKTGNQLDVVAGDGLQTSADSVSVKLDGTTLSASAAGLKIATNGITANELNVSIAGEGLSGGAGSALSVNLGNGLEIVTDNVEIKLDGATLTKSSTGLKVSDGGIGALQLGQQSVTADKIATSVAGNGLIGGNGTALAVGEGDGIDVAADSISVNVSEIVDTTKGLTVSSNDIQVSLDVNGGLRFETGGGIGINPSIAGDGLSFASGVLSVSVGSGIQIVSDQVSLGVLQSNWNTYNGTTRYTITGLADPFDARDAAHKGYVDTQIAANGRVRVERFTLTATDITNKYISLSTTPMEAAGVLLSIKGAPGQFFGEDYQMDGTTPSRLTWASLGLDGILSAGDKLTVTFRANS